MAAACYKFGDGQSNPTKCFPPRTLHRRSKEGAGHWLVAYKKAEEQKCRNVHARIKKAYKECESSRRAGSRGNTLDGPFLLQLHCVDKPSELCTVNISEQKLSSVKPEDLQMFDNVAYIDASVNSLSLGSFGSFVSLRELNLSLNGLCNMTFHAADFPHLQVLDLSYNSLTADDIVSIGRLPCLKVLHLTGNQLHHLPPDLGSSNHKTEQSAEEEDDTCFGALEVLMLDDNKLSSGVFDSLANLKRLKYLNLQGNRISEVTFLQPTGSPKPRQTSTGEQPEEVGPAHTETNPVENLKRVSQENRVERLKRSSVPLPELQSLNLADNKVADEKALTSVQLFPMLREIDIHSNPLTRKRRGDLSERLGITIKRKKTGEVAKPPLKVSADPKWKVKERTPKVSNNKPLIAAAPCPVQTQTPEKGSEENPEHFFVTQATDVPKCELDLGAEARGAVESEADAAPARLMDANAKPNPDVVEPVGIQTAVRMLEHTLKNLNVYRDSKPTLDSIQMPHGEREKRIKELSQLKPIKQPTKRLDEMIKVIKESTSITEVPLSSAMHGTGVNKREHQEALSLLRDMTTKHKMVHKKTMERAAGMERNRHGAEPPPCAEALECLS